MARKKNSIFNQDNKSYVFISNQNVEFNYRILHAGFQCRDSNNPEQIDRYAFNYVVGGELTYCLNNKTYNLKKGDIFVNFPSVKFKMINNDNNSNKFLYVGIYSKNMDTLLYHAGLNLDNPVIHANNDYIEQQMRKIPFLLKQNTFSSIARSKTIFDEILCTLFDLKPENNKPVTSKTVFILNQALEYMEQNYNLPITVNDIAQAIYTSRCYLSTIFKSEYKINIKDYLTNLRLTKAADMLLDTDIPITKIAEATGFNSYVNFYKSFLQHYLTSPKLYRLSAKNFRPKNDKDI